MVGNYKVITLCGSTRFKEQFIEVQKQLTLEGNIVISVGLFGHSGDDEVWTEGTKEMLDDMHKRKIDMADAIYVINVGGYIGDSTKSEIEYAREKGKEVLYYDENEYTPEEVYWGLGGNTGTLPDRITPWRIKALRRGEVFVFGSNSQGMHGAGAAWLAVEKFGAVMGVGEGMQGRSYALPTMEGLRSFAAAVERFECFAQQHKNMKFYVTAVGCGIAGYTPEEIAPFFVDVARLKNVYLPLSFWKVLMEKGKKEQAPAEQQTTENAKKPKPYTDSDGIVYESREAYLNSPDLDSHSVMLYLHSGLRTPQNDWERSLLKEMQEIEASGKLIDFSENIW